MKIALLQASFLPSAVKKPSFRSLAFFKRARSAKNALTAACYRYHPFAGAEAISKLFDFAVKRPLTFVDGLLTLLFERL